MTAAPRRLTAVFSHPAARTLVFADAVGNLGNFIGLGALLLLAYQRSGGSALGPAALFALQAVPGLVAGTVASGWLSRLPVRTGAVTSSTVGAAVLLLPLAVGGLWPVLVATLLLGAVRAVSDPMRSAALAAAVPDELKGRVLTWAQVTFQGGQVAGFVAGASLAVGGAARWALWFDVATFLFTAVVLRRLPALPAGGRRRPGDGLRELRRNRIARSLLPAILATLAVGAIPETLASSLSDDAWVGPLTAVAAAAAAVGAAVAGRTRLLDTPRAMLVVALVVPVGLVSTAVAVAAGAHAAVLLATTGLFGLAAVWVVGAQTTFVRVVAPDRIAQVSATMVAAVMVLEGVGALATGMLADWVGLPATYLVLAVVVVFPVGWSLARAPSAAEVDAAAAEVPRPAPVAV